MPRSAAVRVCRVAAAGGARGRFSRPHVQALGAARAESVHHQEDQVTMRDLLNAEWSAKYVNNDNGHNNTSSPWTVDFSKLIGGSYYDFRKAFLSKDLSNFISWFLPLASGVMAVSEFSFQWLCCGEACRL